MKILYIHQYFKTPREPGGTRSYWISQELIKNGHEVIMITTRAQQTEGLVDEIVDGIRVLSLNVPYSQNMGITKRMKAFTNFMIRASKVGLTLQGIDLVIATSTPLTVGYPALRIKKKLKIPFIFEVRDLWPEVPIQMGALRNPVIRAVAKWFERKIYREATCVIALSPGMKQGVLSCGIAENKVSMIPNMAKVEEFWPREMNLPLIRQLGLKGDSFKVIHFGSLGVANGAEYIINAAKLMNEESNVEFLFAGGGSTEQKLKRLCEESQLTNVHFLGRFAMTEMSEIVNFCDVSLVSFMNLPILYTNSPNKLFDSLSAGKPVIVNSAGWTKDLVEENYCGYFASPYDPQDLVDKIEFLKLHPETAMKMGRNARGLAETKYDRKILCKEYVQLIENEFIKK